LSTYSKNKAVSFGVVSYSRSITPDVMDLETLHSSETVTPVKTEHMMARYLVIKSFPTYPRFCFPTTEGAGIQSLYSVNDSSSQVYEQLCFSIDEKTILILSLALLNLSVKFNVPLYNQQTRTKACERSVIKIEWRLVHLTTTLVNPHLYTWDPELGD
jgi:hypothetical protein